MPPATRPVSAATPDPVLETQLFWIRYRLQILVGLLAILIGLAVFGGYRFYTARRDAAAAARLSEAKSAADYQKVISEYPAAPAAASASLRLAEAQRTERKFAEANTTLKGFIDKHPKHELVTTAQMAMAGNQESLGKGDEALERYRRLAAEHPRSYNAPFALLAQVQLLKQKGRIEEARRVCETVLTQYRESYASTEASRYLRLLKVPAGAAPPPAANPAASAAP